jgi:hypothetical protein
VKVAILDDYQNVALQLADWSGVRRHAGLSLTSKSGLEAAER